MTNTTMKKIILSATTAMFLTACGSSSDTATPTAAETAAAKIVAYAESNTNPTPTLADYTDAGVTGVTSANIDAYNTLVDAKVGTDVDTVAELDDLVADIPVITPTNNAPTANAGSDVSVTVNTPVTITGSGTDTDGTISSYSWTNGTTVLDTTESFDYTPTTEGTDTLTLTVTDDDGATATDTVIVTVTAVGNVAPTANAGADASVEVNTAITLTGSGTDTDGSIASYSWTNATDTVLDTTESFDYTPTTEGTDTLTLTVTDDAGATATDTVDITVTAATTGIVVNGTIVTDNATGLSWDNVITASGECTTKTMRIPTIEEFQTIMDYSIAGMPVISELSDISQGNYGTSDGWKIDGNGGVVKGTATNTICVSGTSTVPAASFTPSTDTVTDNNTGLVWEKGYSAAVAYDVTLCDATLPAGDWRLPTIVELDSIYDRDNNATVAEFDASTVGFWSSTVGANAPAFNWTVRFTDSGDIAGAENTNPLHLSSVRCVKK